MKTFVIITLLLTVSLTVHAGIFSSGRCFLSSPDKIMESLKLDKDNFSEKYEELYRYQNLSTLTAYVKSFNNLVKEFTYSTECLKNKDVLISKKEDLKNIYHEIEEIFSNLEGFKGASSNLTDSYATSLNKFSTLADDLDTYSIVSKINTYKVKKKAENQ